MDIQIKWQKPMLLARHKKIVYHEGLLTRVEGKKPGVYFFSRKYGGEYLPFYIGETMDIRNLLQTHLETRKIADVLRGIDDAVGGKSAQKIRQGARYFHFGYFIGKKGQQPKKCLKIVQKDLIEDAVAKKLPLLNINLTEIETHTILYSGNKIGRSIFPRTKAVKD